MGNMLLERGAAGVLESAFGFPRPNWLDQTHYLPRLSVTYTPAGRLWGARLPGGLPGHLQHGTVARNAICPIVCFGHPFSSNSRAWRQCMLTSSMHARITCPPLLKSSNGMACALDAVWLRVTGPAGSHRARGRQNHFASARRSRARSTQTRLPE